MEQIDTCIEAVASSFLHALVAGSILLAAIFALCRLFPRIPAAIRFGLWWLGCAKILISLLCTVSIPLVLIVPRSFTPRLGTPKSAVQSILRQIVPTRTLTKPIPHAQSPDVARSATPNTGLAPNAAHTDAAPSEMPPEALSSLDPFTIGADLLVFAWIIGAAFQLAGLCRASACLRRLLLAASPVAAPAEMAEMARRLRLRRPVTLRISHAISSPLAAGLFRPVIVFPADFESSFSADEMRIAIVHELAHVRRGDVLLSLVPALAKCLFFFHPLVHLAYRECLNCREEACDAIAIATTVTDPSRYAALLLKTALTRPTIPSSTALAAPGMAAAHFHQLKRRLEAVRSGTRPSPSILTASALTLATLALAVPYRIVLAASGGLRLIPAPPQPALPAYTLTDLGTLGGRSSDAMAINDAGEVVGSANNNRRSTSGHAFLYNDDTGIVDLGASIPYRHSVAAAVNGKGDIVANAFDRNGRALSILSAGGTIRTLHNLPGYRFSRPAAINNSGNVVGTAQNPWPDARGAFRTRAFVYSAGISHDLGTLGGSYSAATSINASGEIAGKADLPATGGEAPATHAFVTNTGSGLRPPILRDLGTLPGGANSVATAVNDAHLVVGVSEVAGGAHHGFRVAGNRMDDLGTLPGTNSSRAYALNAMGAIVGTAYSEGGDTTQQNRRAVLWLPSTAGSVPRIVDLNDLLPPGSPWVLESARGINSRGQIVGQGLIGGERRAFLLTPR